MLVRQLLIYCQTADVREFDFTIGAVGFKSRFANEVRLNRIRSQSTVRRRWRLPAGRWWPEGTGSCAWPCVRGWFREGKAHADRVLALRPRRGARRHHEAVGGAPGADAIAVREGSLGDLADLNVFYPSEVSPDDLHLARRRFKDGHRLFLGTQGEAVTQYAWLGDGRIDDHWVAPARRGDEADFLRQVAAHIKKTA